MRKIFKSSINGQFVTKKYYLKNPKITYMSKVKKQKTKKKVTPVVSPVQETPRVAPVEETKKEIRCLHVATRKQILINVENGKHFYNGKEIILDKKHFHILSEN